MNKFDEDFKNDAILVSVLLDPRFRTFKHPVFDMRDAEKVKAGQALSPTVAAVKELYASLAARQVDSKSLETRMFTGAVKMYQKWCPVEWAREYEQLSETAKREVDAGNMKNHPLWSDLQTWGNMRAVNISIDGSPLTLLSDPLAFWRQNEMFNVLKPLARHVLSIPATAISVERLWSSSEAVLNKTRASLKIDTAGRQVFVRQVWRVADTMLASSTLSSGARLFYESLRPFVPVASASNKGSQVQAKKPK